MDCRSESKKYALSLILVASSALCLGLPPANAEEADGDSSGMKVYGQSELPKVLYIVPWKRKKAADSETLSSKNMARDMLDPIDSEVFSRQVRYYQIMMQHTDDKATQP